ncbi:hypothetical protein [Staphylococcus caprae]|uniref:hypothetical protein n=2 Tax=Bacteria TaxID=2 RepID=UPI001451FDCD|nr:hypothetical protein [Staphylococcus caprae]QJE26607.1 hypothetical protein HHJ99_12620 [Staphylococcus caprae]QJE26618.1 hypothetical protein HHJ99_12675 [Staphylococcus caprae]
MKLMKHTLTIEKDVTFEDGTQVGKITNNSNSNNFRVFQSEDNGLYFKDRNEYKYLNDMMLENDYNKVQDTILMFLFSEDKANQTTEVEISLY